MTDLTKWSDAQLELLNVEKISGYRWPGRIVSVFRTIQGERRVVVECTVSEVAGALHIYSLNQLKPNDH